MDRYHASLATTLPADTHVVDDAAVAQATTLTEHLAQVGALLQPLAILDFIRLRKHPNRDPAAGGLEMHYPADARSLLDGISEIRGQRCAALAIVAGELRSDAPIERITLQS